MVIEGGVLCHMDDVLVWGESQAQHDERLHTVLARIEKAGITLNLEKCELGRQEVKFLGHLISESGVRPDPDKTRAVLEMKEPSTISQVRSFLGMVNQLGKFIPCLAEKDRPLRDLLSKRNHWGWSKAQQEAFSEHKRELSSTPVLALYNPNKELKLSADASSYGLGAVLLQKEEEQWKPVAYASRSLTPKEQRYAQVEKEALSLTWGCERFKDFLIEHHFHLETDHKPLVSLLGIQELAELPPRIQRFRLRLMRYNYTITHIPGKTLVTADTLSHSPVTNSLGEHNFDANLMEDTNIYVETVIGCMPSSPNSLAELREQLKTDPTCSEVMKRCQEGWPDLSHITGEARKFWPERTVLTVHGGLLLKGSRLVIPSAMRNTVLEKLHEGHQGVARCRLPSESGFSHLSSGQRVWITDTKGLSGQINDLVQNCTTCIKGVLLCFFTF